MTALLGVPAHPADRAAYDDGPAGERGGHGGVCEHCQACSTASAIARSA